MVSKGYRVVSTANVGGKTTRAVTGLRPLPLTWLKASLQSLVKILVDGSLRRFDSINTLLNSLVSLGRSISSNPSPGRSVCSNPGETGKQGAPVLAVNSTEGYSCGIANVVQVNRMCSSGALVPVVYSAKGLWLPSRMGVA